MSSGKRAVAAPSQSPPHSPSPTSTQHPNDFILRIHASPEAVQGGYLGHLLSGVDYCQEKRGLEASSCPGGRRQRRPALPPADTAAITATARRRGLRPMPLRRLRRPRPGPVLRQRRRLWCVLGYRRRPPARPCRGPRPGGLVRGRRSGGAGGSIPGPGSVVLWRPRASPSRLSSGSLVLPVRILRGWGDLDIGKTRVGAQRANARRRHERGNWRPAAAAAESPLWRVHV